jgi:hypothetical protein
MADMSLDDPQPNPTPISYDELAALVRSSKTERRRWLRPQQPGDWLLLIFLVGGLLQAIGWLIFARAYDLTFANSGCGDTVWAWLVCNVFSSPALVVLLIAAAACSSGRIWKALFAARVMGEALMTIAAILAIRVWLATSVNASVNTNTPPHFFTIHGPTGFLYFAALYFPPLFGLAILLLLAAAVIADLCHQTHRRWTHWLGVCCLAVGNPIAAAYWLNWVFGGTIGLMFGK